MSTTALKICVEALSLPRESRAEIAERLLASLENEKAVSRAERLWRSEIRRRRKEIRQGTAKLTPADEVMRKAFEAIS